MSEDERLSELPPTADSVRIPERFAPQLELCERLLSTVWDERPRPQPSMSEVEANCLAILVRSLEIYDAVVALVRAGRMLPALMLDRALFEDMVAAFWLSHPDNRETGLQRIRDQEDYIVLLSNDLIRNYPHRVLVTADEHEDLEEKRDEFKKTFGAHGNRTWFGDIYTAIGQIAPLWERLGGEEETLRVYYAFVHRHINLHVHNTVSSIKRSLARYDEPRKVDDSEVTIALRAAFFCLLGLAHLAFDESGVNRDSLSELERESHRIFIDLDPKKRGQMGRNEPCWCGSGKKLKLCHGA